MFKIMLMLLQVIRLIPMDSDQENNTNKQEEAKSPGHTVPSWVGDLILMLFLFPVIGAFLPWTRDAVRDGLELLKDIPDWFSFIIVLIVVSAIGLRRYIVDIIDRFSNRRG